MKKYYLYEKNQRSYLMICYYQVKKQSPMILQPPSLFKKFSFKITLFITFLTIIGFIAFTYMYYNDCSDNIMTCINGIGTKNMPCITNDGTYYCCAPQKTTGYSLCSDYAFCQLLTPSYCTKYKIISQTCGIMMIVFAITIVVQVCIFKRQNKQPAQNISPNYGQYQNFETYQRYNNYNPPFNNQTAYGNIICNQSGNNSVQAQVNEAAEPLIFNKEDQK